MNISRKLAVIMFIDMTGFTRLMGQNEAEAMRLLRILREIERPLLQQYNGVWLKEMGDGLMCSFSSVSNALHCALSIQREASKHKGLLLKIGLHLGEVIEEEGDVFGDGVNIASRIESIGVGGAVLFSKKIRDEIKNSKDFEYRSLGKFEFVNVDEPLEIFALTNEGLVFPERKSLKGKLRSRSSIPAAVKYAVLSLIVVLSGALIYLIIQQDQVANATAGDKDLLALSDQSIAVIPFENLTREEETDYFSQGVADEIRSQLATFQDLRVISRSSSMQFKDSVMGISEIRETLKTNYLLEGMLWFDEDSFRIRVFLTDTKSDSEIWTSEWHEGSLDELIPVQGRLVNEVASNLGLIGVSEEGRFGGVNKVDPAIYNLWLKAWNLHESYTPAGFDQAFDIGKEIIHRDSSFALGYFLLGDYYLMNGVWFGGIDPESARTNAISYFEKGLEIDPKNALCHVGLGNSVLFFEHNFQKASELFQTAASKGEPRAVLALSMFNLYRGKFEEADQYLEEFMELDPLNVFSGFFKGRILFFNGKFEQAESILKAGIEDYQIADYYHSLGKLYLNTNRFGETIEVLEAGIAKTGQNIPSMLADMAIAYFKLGNTGAGEKIIRDLETRYENNEFGSPAFYLAQIYAGMGDKEQCISWLEKSFERNETELIWLKIEPQFQALRGDPDFEPLLGRIAFMY